MDILLIFACFYFAFTQAKALIDYGNQPWELVHYLLLLLTIVLAALGIFRSYLYYKEWKYKKEHPEEDALLQTSSTDDTDEEEKDEEDGAAGEALPAAAEDTSNQDSTH